MQTSLKFAVLTGAALLGVAAAPQGMGWTNAINLSSAGNPVMGNPAAGVRLTEHVSYSCAECARYNIQSDAVLKLAYVPSGRIAIEVQLLAENPVDLAAAMLARCGAKERFFLNHNMLLRSQPKWLPMLRSATPSQRQRWTGPDLGTRNRAIAGDFGLYAVMAARGYDRLTVDRCLNDKVLGARIAAGSAAAIAAGAIETPGFSINGKLLEKTHDWASLRPQLDESLK